MILKDRFEPNFLKIELGSIVLWSISNDEGNKNDESQNQIFSSRKRYHVISFDKLNEESDPLSLPNDSYQY